MSYVSPLEPIINVPAAPVLSSSTPAHIATGQYIAVSWGAAADATCYDIYLRNSAGNVCAVQTGSTGNTTAFTINDAGTYSVTAISRNSKYTSSACLYIF